MRGFAVGEAMTGHSSPSTLDAFVSASPISIVLSSFVELTPASIAWGWLIIFMNPTVIGVRARFLRATRYRASSGSLLLDMEVDCGSRGYSERRSSEVRKNIIASS
jgi:hypothetical protein